MHIKAHLPFLSQALFVLILTALAIAPCSAQTTVPSDSIRVQVADFRGRGFVDAATAALVSSEKGVVVVMVCGAEQDVIDSTVGNLKALIRQGYNRVGVILSDPDPDTKDNPMVALFAAGDNHAYMTKVSDIALYEIHLYKSVKDLYERYVLAPSED